MVTGNFSLSMLLQRLWSSQHLCQVLSVFEAIFHNMLMKERVTVKVQGRTPEEK
jgi:hypothetical protein